MTALGGNARGKLMKALSGGLSLALALTTVGVTPADARHRFRSYHHRSHHAHHAFHSHRSLRYSHRARQGVGESYSPRFAAIVVDANSGRTLYAKNENELRHPASVTKVMTLYLLFEQLEKGRLNLDSEIGISEHAAEQEPSKLGLRPGSSIAVEDAIKAVVTKSANDVAVAIAEKIGGDEDTFAQMMTRKAHALGMTRTHYANASGLPNDEQITTARDLTVLGRSIQERFPRYYRYFSTPSFRYGRSYMRNHNHLLGRVEGMDGIKTGYTRASGFNLLTSVHRDGHWIVSVVLGGTSWASRDRIMAGLIEEHIDEGARSRTATMIAEQTPADIGRETAAIEAPKPAPRFEPVIAERSEPVQTIRMQPTNVAAYAPPAASLPAPSVHERARPAFVAGTPKASPDESGQRGRVILDGSTGRPVSASAGMTATPSSMRWIGGPAPAKTAKAEARIEVARAEPAHALATRSDAEDTPLAHAGRPQNAGWMIQIGATDEAVKAQDLLNRAKGQSSAALGRARPFTEKIQKGSETLWRARFAGLEEQSAEAACKALKRAGFSCFATKN
jgi:D-alanyl-D-alanine carboxypeptidase